MPTVYVLNGPNLNLLGSRETSVYGATTLADIEKLCGTAAKKHGLESGLQTKQPRRRTRGLAA